MNQVADVSITLPDGKVVAHPKGTTIQQVAASIGERLGQDAIAGRLGGPKSKLVDVHTPITEDTPLSIVTVRSEPGLEVLRHSCSHLMASAVQKLYPGTQVTFGPAVENGFYYDFFREAGPFTPDDLDKIAAEMKTIITEKSEFQRETISRDEARALFDEMGERFKLEHVDRIDADAELTLYRHGDWVDLCEGPHVRSTKYLKYFELTHVAGAYWLGDECNPMLTRIYGTCFWDKKALKKHLADVEEARKRDHRKLGTELDLFSFHHYAPAMPFFHPKGTIIYNQLVDFIRNYYRAVGFSEVLTPQVVDAELFKASGHYANYKDNMFFVQVDEREYGVKPMNCPGHTLIYSSRKRSYRDLPIRYGDFGRVHRYERSGVTAGLTRVRTFSIDDGHIFCREDQVTEEIAQQIAVIHDVYSHFGFETRFGFSTRPEGSIGREEGLSDAERDEWNVLWGKAESALKAALDAEQGDYETYEGEGAFYGPKIDFEVRDALSRWHQLATIQLDFSMPRKFDLKYTSEANTVERPVMVHRAVLGSVERFLGILIEHYGGDFPLWLAPVQVRVLTITNDDELEAYGQEVCEKLHAQGIRVAFDNRNEKLGYKIREAELQKIPFVAVIGAKERDAGAVALRRRRGEDLGQLPLDRALSLVLDAAAVPEPGEALLRRVKRKFNL